MAKLEGIPECAMGCQHEHGHSDEADPVTGFVRFMLCTRCIADKPDGTLLAEHARLAVGITAEGKLRVWCHRHNVSLADLDLA